MNAWPEFGWWRSWISIAVVLCSLGCAAKTLPQQCLTQPPNVITIANAQVGVRYQPFSVAPISATWTVCGTLPPGMNITASGENLWIGGTPTVSGTYRFWIQQ